MTARDLGGDNHSSIGVSGSQDPHVNPSSREFASTSRVHQAAQRPRRRVVVTGVGAITPLGLSVDTFWENLIAGKSGIAPMTLCDPAGYPCSIAGEIKGFDPRNHMDSKEARRMARFSQIAIAATGEALGCANLRIEQEDPTRVGVLLGNGNGGFPNIDQEFRTLMTRGGMKMSPMFFPMVLPNMAASQVSINFGIKGYTSTVVTACAAGAQAIGEAAEVLRRGAADVMITGGAEAGISELGLAGFSVIRAFTSKNDPPERASRPFDANRDGFIPAEGSAILVLETLEHAERRGARILAEVAGYGVTADAHHVVAPDPKGNGAARAMQLAVEDAGLQPEDIDYINAHGTSTPVGDIAETVAIKKAFGPHAYRIPVSSTKSMIGHALGAAGGLEAVVCILTILSGVIHPTINYETPDPACDLDYVPNVPRRADVGRVLSNSFGFGGQNACLVFQRFEE